MEPTVSEPRANNSAGAIVCLTTDKILEYRDLIKVPKLRQTWMIYLANKLRRLAQGIRRTKGTNTIYSWIRRLVWTHKN